MLGSRLALTALLFTPALAAAQASTNYECVYGDLVRRVVIVSEPGVSVPCEVHYYKETEAPGDMQVLWSAAHEAGFCETRTDEFVAKLSGMGWQCEGSNDPYPEPDAVAEDNLEEAAETAAEDASEDLPADAVDDTEILEPVPPGEGDD